MVDDVIEKLQTFDWQALLAAVWAPLARLYRPDDLVAVAMLILTALATLIILLKLLQFALRRVGARRGLRAALRLWLRGPKVKALRKVARRRSPAARALAAALHGLAQQPPERVRVSAEQVGRAELEKLRGGLLALRLVALTAPLFGLLVAALRLQQAAQTAPGAPLDLAVLGAALPPLSLGLLAALLAGPAVLWFERRLAGQERFIDELLGQVFAAAGTADAEITLTSPPPAPPRGGKRPPAIDLDNLTAEPPLLRRRRG